MEVLEIFFPFLLQLRRELARLHAKVVLQLVAEVRCHLECAGIIEMVAAVLAVPRPVEAGRAGAVVVVVCQSVFVSKLLHGI